MSKIFAVATNTIRQALRLKIAVAFIILLGILLPVMGSVMVGDGTLQGRLQTFVSYGLSLTTLLLSMLTIIISIYTLTSDVAQRQIYTVITKPIRRWQLIAGKLLGVILLNAALLTLFAALIYGITIYIPGFVDAPPDEIARANVEFFTARDGIKPLQTDISDQVRQEFERRRSADEIPEEVLINPRLRQREMDSIRESLRLRERSASSGHSLTWDFRNVQPADPEQNIYIRFKYQVSDDPPEGMIHSRWQIGDIRQMQAGRPETPIYRTERSDSIRVSHEIAVPADAIADDGYLGVRFISSPQNRTVVMFPTDEGIEVLYKAGEFASNYFRAILLIFIRLVFLAVLGIMAATFLSFPVAILLCLVVFLTSIASGFIIEAIGFFATDSVERLYDFTIKPLIYMLPRFDTANPSEYLIPARLIRWSLIGEMAGIMIGVKALILLLLAILIFSYRELAKIVV